MSIEQNDRGATLELLHLADDGETEINQQMLNWFYLPRTIQCSIVDETYMQGRKESDLHNFFQWNFNAQ